MNREFLARGGIFVPEGLDLSGSIWIQCGVDVYDGGKWEHDEKFGLINVGGKQVGSYVGPAKSFMRNFTVAFIRSLFYDPDDISEQYVTDTATGGNTAKEAAMHEGRPGSGQGLTAGVAEFAFGDNNTAVSATQSDLQGLILGPSLYGTVTTTVLQEDAVQRVFKVEGTVLNGGSSFGIQEVGLFARLRDGAVASQNYRSMFMRDLVSPTVTVANGQTALGRYTFTAAI